MKFKQNQLNLIPSKIIILALFVGGVLFSCSEDEPALSESFFKIYDDSDFDVSYNPIDVVEVEGGYIILTGTERNNTDFICVLIIHFNIIS